MKVRATICDQRAFSLIEMLITIMLIGIITAIAFPAYQGLNRALKRSNAVKQVEFDLRRLQAEALARGVRAIFQLAEDGREYRAGFDYLPYTSPPEIDQELYSFELPSTVIISGPSAVIFDSRGFSINSEGTSTSAQLSLAGSDGKTHTLSIAAIGSINVSLAESG